MRLLNSALVTLLAFARLSFASSSSGDSVLVLLDPSLDRENYSIFFGGLEKRGYNLTFRAPKDVSPAITDYGVPNFDHVILFAPDTKSYARDITPQSLVGLLSENTNLLIALSPKQTPLTSFATEFSLILPPPETPLISHHPARSEPPTTIPVSVPQSPLLTPGIPPIWFTGAPHALGTTPMLVPILRAPAESFAADPTSDADSDALVDATEKGGEGLWAGSQMGLVTGFQTNVNSRVIFAGGVQLFSDEYARKELPSGKPSGNSLFARDVAAWVFQEKLALRIDGVEHHRVNQTEAPEMYTTNDEIVYTAHISSYDSKTSTWKPYSGIEDLQLEFTMLDPHIRTSLPPVPGSPGTYQVQFRAPDRHGVFKFVLNWKRKGYSYLESSTTVPVVPPRHDQYPRFLSAAWPYYAGAISTSVGFFLFAALWLAGDVKGERKKGSKAE
ncbi:Dolichyl-diphosphooligosaccharide--protein glycosyltransferase subunit WBP1 [Suillus clintonianus]|uniref:Dolichyl-diphosphooligosaccharide--protein glycosyltransferase subunit WBP1 n=1 Tax=Suillus clintonianus TaxID=1904413 RepID=UPI001B85DEB4|nr:Dolichyl-diphosphooligosaccharide--protein glycosyltransferase subunit WBP1 [Suillus clintonianus]KAG2139009.1 Dolichyl-diphosphooligosaccharide--protein glycosyltransferase subunit WBP1 [Suillus clintonianus]